MTVRAGPGLTWTRSLRTCGLRACHGTAKQPGGWLQWPPPSVDPPESEALAVGEVGVGWEPPPPRHQCTAPSVCCWAGLCQLLLLPPLHQHQRQLLRRVHLLGQHHPVCPPQPCPSLLPCLSPHPAPALPQRTLVTSARQVAVAVLVLVLVVLVAALMPL